MTEIKGKRVSGRQLATRTIKELEEEVAYFKENVPLLLKEIERLKCQVQEFEAIGTIEEFRDLKDKSEPKEVTYQIDTSGHKHEKCPTCGSFHVFGKYCTECGQSIVKWWQ